MTILHYEYPNPIDNKGAGIEVRSTKELSDNELFLLQQASLDKYGELEAWTAIGTNTQLSYATHGIFRYFGKFPSTIATHLIMKYTKEYDNIFDPMGGSGSTIVEALLLNRNCISYDINPLSVILQKVKITHIDKEKLDKELDRIINVYKPLSSKQFDWAPVGLRNLDHWFLKETQDSIRGLIYIINNIVDDNIRNFFSICLASSIRAVSRATTQQGRLFLDIDTAKEDCLETFIKKAKKAINAVASIPKSKVKLIVDVHNVQDEVNMPDNNSLIIAHPPYFNSYKYSSINSLELSWMKINHAFVRQKEVREFFKVGKSEKVTYYIDDMNRALCNIVKTLKTKGILALMIGDTRIKGEYIPVTKMLIDKFLSANSNISIEKVILRVPKYTEASWTASQRRNSEKVGITLNDFIILFRRNF